MTRQYADLELFAWRQANNTGSPIINPYEVCEVVDGSGLPRATVGVSQPTSPLGDVFVVNGPTAMAASRHGRVCFGPVVLVKYDSGEVPEFNSMWGPEAGSGSLVSESGQFRCLRVVSEDDKLMLAYVGGAGGEGALVRLTDSCPAASGDPRVPGTTTAYTRIKGADPTGAPIENWSVIELPDGMYGWVEPASGDWVMIEFYC
jgi:hypothetical protein